MSENITEYIESYINFRKSHRISAEIGVTAKNWREPPLGLTRYTLEMQCATTNLVPSASKRKEAPGTRLRCHLFTADLEFSRKSKHTVALLPKNVIFTRIHESTKIRHLNISQHLASFHDKKKFFGEKMFR